MEFEEGCGDFQDPMLAENLPKYPTCICCDKGTPISSLDALPPNFQCLIDYFLLMFTTMKFDESILSL